MIELLGAGESALRDRRLREIIKSSDEFDLEIFRADASDASAWFASAATAPFLGEFRTVVVRNLLRAEPDKGFVMPVVPDHGRLVLVADEERGDDNRQKKFNSNLTAWTKLVTKAKGTVTGFELNAKQLRENLREEAQSAGKSLSPRAADLLAEITGGSFSRASEEIEKLAIYVGESPEISETAIKSVVMASREWNVWRLLDSVTSGQAGAALTQLRILLGGNTKAEEAAYRNVMPMLTRQLRLVWQARLCVEANCEPGNAPATVRAGFPDGLSLARQGEFVVRGCMRTAREVKLDQIAQAFQHVSDADARLKGMLPAYNATDTLEQLILALVDTFRPAKAA